LQVRLSKRLVAQLDVCLCYAYIMYRRLTIKYECMLIADELQNYFVESGEVVPENQLIHFTQGVLNCSQHSDITYIASYC